MKLSVLRLGISLSIVGALAVFLTGLANLLWTGYGEGFLRIVDSLYPGYHYGGGFLSVIVGSLYAALDGFVTGAVIALFYNLFGKKKD
ncbi:hypothetical protein NLD30_09750 [SCandidatus Aminicenantes bacterium Aminicenantia_JdfR_composite]|jgi:hypothetical protein|nr:hypothetical protein [SCandidatus Aminicenantes bacterium Aminicenantia_JdfR_composite]MCP2597624.1 hypothetical protein [Candidatus Aminicenantes bacterium AC-335-G13]MCP2621181.1 hypothetical protein [Candidatus Aminicenantes bacterium AC-334-E05]